MFNEMEMAAKEYPHVVLLHDKRVRHYQLEPSYEAFMDKFGITPEHMDLDGSLQCCVMEPRQGKESQAGMDVSSVFASASASASSSMAAHTELDKPHLVSDVELTSQHALWDGNTRR